MIDKLKNTIAVNRDRIQTIRLFFRNVEKFIGDVDTNIKFSNMYEEGDGELITIAFYPTGGFGDYIISSKLLDEILMNETCRIDVFCENIVFGDAIYGNRPKTRVFPYEEFEQVRCQYNLVLRVEHFIHVLNYDFVHVTKISKTFADKISLLQKSMVNIRPTIEQQYYREAIHFKRCEINHINRWTELRHNNIFKIENQRTAIFLKEDYYNIFLNYGLKEKKYITVNRGADSMGRSTMQTKVWPEEHYVELVRLLKEKYRDIEIVQLGSKSNTKIQGVDQYILGESLETVKWILKYSLLHIDCEGGLVHLATQLSTKCAVIFGPTPLYFYSYPQNMNIVSKECNNCMGTHKDWAFSCYKGLAQAECMYSISSKIVFDKIENFLKEELNNEKSYCNQYINTENLTVNAKYDIKACYESTLKENRELTCNYGNKDSYQHMLNYLTECETKGIVVIINSKKDFISYYLRNIGYKVIIIEGEFADQNTIKINNELNEYKKKNIKVIYGNYLCVPVDNHYCDIVIEFGDEHSDYSEPKRILKTKGRYYKI